MLIAAWTTAVVGQRAVLDEADLEGFDPTIARQVREAVDGTVAGPTAERFGRLGLLLHAYDRFDAAARAYGQARRLDPQTFRWGYCLALALEQGGDLEAAAAALEQALAVQPDDVAARNRLASIWFALGRLDDSVRLYRDVVRAAPGSAKAHYGLGRVLAASDAEAAIGHFERAIALAPRYGSAHYALAMAYRGRGDLERAEIALRQFKATRDDEPEIDQLAAEIAAQRAGPFEDLATGRSLLNAGRPGDALLPLERAVRARPDLVQAHVNLIAAYGGIGDVEKAGQAYQTAISLSPELPEAHYNVGVLWLAHGRPDAARTAFERAVAASPSHADARNNLGYLLVREGRIDDGEAHYRRALEVQPGHRDAHFNLARVLQERGRPNDAIAHFARAAEKDDERTALYLYYLADAHARLGRVDEALIHARVARERAVAHGQVDLVARIESDISRLQELSGRR